MSPVAIDPGRITLIKFEGIRD
jgi:hypothetical protein